MDGQQVATLIRDALSEFINTRRDSLQYVNARYPEWSDKDKQDKQLQVEARVKLAKSLHELSSVIAEKIVDDSSGKSSNTYVVLEVSGRCSKLRCVDFIGREDLGDGIMCDREGEENWVAHYHLPLHLRNIGGRGSILQRLNDLDQGPVAQPLTEQQMREQLQFERYLSRST